MKIFKFLFVFILIMLLNCSDSYAAEVPALPVESRCSEYIIVRNLDVDSNQYNYTLFYHAGWDVYYRYDQLQFTNGNQTYYQVYELDLETMVWVFKYSNESTGAGFTYSDTQEVIYSTLDIKNTDGSIFFQATPTPMTYYLMMSGTVTPKVLRQVVYLIPCLISLVIGLIAFRKGWNWLKIQLQV